MENFGRERESVDEVERRQLKINEEQGELEVVLEDKTIKIIKTWKITSSEKWTAEKTRIGEVLEEEKTKIDSGKTRKTTIEKGRRRSRNVTSKKGKTEVDFSKT